MFKLGNECEFTGKRYGVEKFEWGNGQATKAKESEVRYTELGVTDDNCYKKMTTTV